MPDYTAIVRKQLSQMPPMTTHVCYNCDSVWPTPNQAAQSDYSYAPCCEHMREVLDKLNAL